MVIFLIAGHILLWYDVNFKVHECEREECVRDGSMDNYIHVSYCECMHIMYVCATVCQCGGEGD